MGVVWNPTSFVKLPAEAVTATLALLDRVAASGPADDPTAQRARRLRTLLALAAAQQHSPGPPRVDPPLDD
jgi:hypothetical protein